MKKILALLLAVTLCSVFTLAGAESPLISLCNAATKLVLVTDNVAISATLDLSLDGTPFKHAELSHIQTNGDYLRDVYLSAPREDGTTKENGYTIFARGEQFLRVNSYDRIPSSTWRLRERTSVLTPSVSLYTLVRMTKGILQLADGVLPEGSVTMDAGNVITVKLKEQDIPAAANSLVNMMLEHFGLRTRYIEYELIKPYGYTDISDYYTVTQGILFTTRDLKIQNVDVSASMDDKGRLTGAQGSVDILLIGRTGQEHTLSCTLQTFSARYDSVELPDFRPSTDSRWQ